MLAENNRHSIASGDRYTAKINLLILEVGTIPLKLLMLTKQSIELSLEDNALFFFQLD